MGNFTSDGFDWSSLDVGSEPTSPPDQPFSSISRNEPICELFSVQCDLFGFSVKADETCRLSDFGHVPNDYRGMFVSGREKQEDSSNCYFSPDGSVNFRFDECGTNAR